MTLSVIRRLAAVLASVALLAGCGSAEPAPSSGAVTKTSPSAAPQFAACDSVTGASAKDLPDLTLPCFTGGRNVNIGQIRGPAVINLWASWCSPCRAELPAIQRLADRIDGRAQVIGVVSSDTRGAAESLAHDLGVTFPTLYDREGALLKWLGRSALPVTVLIDAKGRISHTYNGEALDDTNLAGLVDRYLGIVVPA